MMEQRSTFREVCSDIAWQKQLRDQYQNEYTPPDELLQLKKAIVRPVNYAFAKKIIHKYEWLGTMSTTKYHYGIFFDSFCAGVVCISTVGGAASNLFLQFGLNKDELIYLARGANVHWSPKGANSKLVSWAMKLIKKDCPSAKLIIAYSDTDAGEIGTIYQACNWICIGKGASTRQWIAPNGRVYDQKYPSDKARRYGGTRADWANKLKKAGWREQDSNPKWRYVFILDKNDTILKDRIESMRVSYPKRGSSIAGDAPSVQQGKASSTLSDPLQLSSESISHVP